MTRRPDRHRPLRNRLCAALLLAVFMAAFALALTTLAGSAAAAPVAPSVPTATTATTTTTTAAPTAGRAVTSPKGPKGPASPKSPTGGQGSVTVNIGGNKPSQSMTVLVLLTVLAIAPSLLLLVTSFTKIFIVLSLTRNALGLQSVPPNQVLAGLSVFLSLFVMGPVLTKVNKLGIQPYLNGTKSQKVAWADGIRPLRDFLLSHTRPEEIALMLRAGNLHNPASKSQLELTTIIPAFVLSELRSAMIIGFIVFIPFVIIDLVVSSSLMSLGMMMLPPVSVSLPFKLLLFVMVDGWGLIVTSLVQSYRTG